MKSVITAILAYALAAMSIVGCSPAASPIEKSRSFAPLEAHHVAGVAFRQYMQDRTALLLAGAEVRKVTPPLGDNGDMQVELTVEGGKDHPAGYGSACALPQDGYYLTAAHCLINQPIWLVAIAGDKPAFALARVVWSDPEADLAVLYSPLQTAGRFAWDQAAVIEDQPIATLGAASGPSAGRLFQAVYPNERHGVMDVLHSAPLLKSDSGGPLMTLKGELIGVNVQVARTLLMTKYSTARRPDIRKINEIIARDEQKLSSK